MFIDSHCHLSFPELKARLPDILADMRHAQVDQAICICTQMEEFEAVGGASGVAQRDDGVERALALVAALAPESTASMQRSGNSCVDYLSICERSDMGAE